MGEAAFKISPDFKALHPELPWPAIAGMRHRLVHDYTRIDLTTVWRVVEIHLPAMLRVIEPLVPPETDPGAAPGPAPKGETPEERQG